jgi:hypothetical protein
LIKISKHLGLAPTNKLCDGVWVGEFWGKWRDKHDFEPVSSVTEVHTMYETITSLFCKYNICKHDEQNVLQVKFSLLCLNFRISSKQLSITDLFGEKSDLDARINAIFYLFFVGLRVKFKFSFVSCFWHISMLSLNHHFPEFIILFHQSLEKWWLEDSLYL